MRTTIIVKYDCGYQNTLTIRGNGCPSLSWEMGTSMHNVKSNEWVWETDETFEAIYFKVLINDELFELGEDHQLICGNTFEYSLDSIDIIH